MTSFGPAAAPMAAAIDASPQLVPLTLYQGDDFFLDLDVSDPNGAPADLTDVVAEAQIRANPAADEVMASFDASIEDATVHLHLTHDEAAKLSGKSAVWDCQLTDAQDVVTTIAAGKITVKPEVTRP